MSETVSPTLAKILAVSRPFEPFEAEIAGQKFTLYARRVSWNEQQTIFDLWESEYANARKTYNDADVDTASIYAELRKLDTTKLAEYVADADSPDIRRDVQQYIGEGITQEEVEEAVKKAVADRATELASNHSQSELLGLAIDRRSHYYASSKANELTSRVMASYTIFEEPSEDKPLFSDEKQASSLVIGDLMNLLKAAGDATKDKEAPLL